ncbi:uncharacterized protein LOC110599559 [Ictidomys tridecemlineatus]
MGARRPAGSTLASPCRSSSSPRPGAWPPGGPPPPGPPASPPPGVRSQLLSPLSSLRVALPGPTPRPWTLRPAPPPGVGHARSPRRVRPLAPPPAIRGPQVLRLRVEQVFGSWARSLAVRVGGLWRYQQGQGGAARRLAGSGTLGGGCRLQGCEHLHRGAPDYGVHLEELSCQEHYQRDLLLSLQQAVQDEEEAPSSKFLASMMCKADYPPQALELQHKFYIKRGRARAKHHWAGAGPQGIFPGEPGGRPWSLPSSMIHPLWPPPSSSSTQQEMDLILGR